VLAHGAGADMRSPFMEGVATGIATRSVAVWRFNFPYRQNNRKVPDRAAVLEETFRAVGDHVRESGAHRQMLLGGKSMGGRIASQIVAQGFPADGLVFLGYPLHPPGRPERVRDDHLYEVSAPMLFVAGTRDPLCRLDLLEEVRSRLVAPSTLAVIDGGDHSFKVPKSSGRSSAEALREVISAVRGWIGGIGPEG
jgi:uncharacterized protein